MYVCTETDGHLQVLHPQSMRPAREAGIPVRVKNSYNPKAPGTVITRSRDMSKVAIQRPLQEVYTVLINFF